MEKLSNWTFGVGQKNLTLTPSVVRNLTRLHLKTSNFLRLRNPDSNPPKSNSNAGLEKQWQIFQVFKVFSEHLELKKKI